MTVAPVGTLTTVRDYVSKGSTFELARGVTAFPSVGDQVLMPTAAQIEAIVGGNDSERRVYIGTSPMAANARIMVDPDKLFGRHLAILGNTGSGKSCTVAGLIRWSIEAADEALKLRARTSGGAVSSPNMRFIVLDPNGEYAKAFEDMPGKVRVFKPGDPNSPFVLPAWFWNSHEWSSITEAKPGAQRPILMQALRSLRAGRLIQEPVYVSIIRQVRMFKSRIITYISYGSGLSFTRYPELGNCLDMFLHIHVVMTDYGAKITGSEPAYGPLNRLAAEAKQFYDRHQEWSDKAQRFFGKSTNVVELQAFLPMLSAIESSLPNVANEEQISEDSPIPFPIDQLADFVDALSAGSASNPNVSSFIATLSLRIRSMMADQRLAPVIAPKETIEFAGWLEGLLGEEGAGSGVVAIVDLSLIPSDVIHILIAVMARLVFEASQRYRKINPEGHALPTTLILEEAHTFVRRGSDDASDTVSPARLCREAFERIAREGRKFGLGLVLSSQRPYELSPTVLAQCNTFLLHRLVNDADQQLVAKLVPDNVAGLLRELPSLPSRNAIMLGWATPIPVLIEVGELQTAQRPQSADPDFWRVWTRSKDRPIDWKQIAEDWIA